MNNNETLLQKQNALKNQILSGSQNTFIRKLLLGVGKPIQQIRRKPAPPPFWYCALMISLLALIVDLLLSARFGEFEVEYRRSFLPLELMITAMMFFIIVALNIYLDYLHDIFNKRIVVNLLEIDDLIDLEVWFQKLWNNNQPILFGLMGVLLGASYFVVPIVVLQIASKAIGTIFLGSIFFFLGGIGLYYFYVIANLPLRLSRYSIKLFRLDPRNSEIIEDISSIVMNFIYLISILMAIATITLTMLGWTKLPVFTPVILGVWGLIIILFIMYQHAMRKIISKNKWKTLNEIQLQIEQIYDERSLDENDRLDTITNLMNFHNHIKGTSNTALDFRAGLNFINSLLLPLLAFFLSNLNTIIELLYR